MDSGAANRKGYSRVGFDGKGTVIRAQGIAWETEPYLKRDSHQKVAK